MNIQTEKIELIRLITDVDNLQVLKKIRAFLSNTQEKDDSTVSPAMTKRLEESRGQIKEGKIVKITLDEIWK